MTKGKYTIKTLLCGVLAAASCFVCAAAAETSVYTDVSVDDWYYDDIMTLTEQGIVNGVGSNQFAPDRNVTGDELVTMLVRSLDNFNNEEVSMDDAHRIAVKRRWYAQDFDMTQPLTREQAAVVLADASGVIQWEQEDTAITDRSMLSPQYENAVDCVINLGLMDGYDYGYFCPQNNITRAEACRIVRKLQTMYPFDCNMLAPDSIRDLKIEYLGDEHMDRYTFIQKDKLLLVPEEIIEHYVQNGWTLCFTADLGIEFPEYSYAVGITSPRNKKIAVVAQPNSLMISSETIIHEFGHYLFGVMLRDNEEIHKGFEEAYATEADAMEKVTGRVYTTRSVDEFFAESFKAYICDGPYDDQAPLTYSLMEQVAQIVWE